MNRHKLIIGGLVIAVFLGLGMLSFKKTLTPYVTFAEARSSKRMVQVKGYPDHANARFDPDLKAFAFNMTDESGDNIKVVYHGAKPGNFEQAVSVVAIGKYQGNALDCSQLLVKCPSKYEAQYPGATGHPSDIPVGPAAQHQPMQPGPSGDGSKPGGVSGVEGK